MKRPTNRSAVHRKALEHERISVTGLAAPRSQKQDEPLTDISDQRSTGNWRPTLGEVCFKRGNG